MLHSQRLSVFNKMLVFFHKKPGQGYYFCGGTTMQNPENQSAIFNRTPNQHLTASRHNYCGNTIMNNLHSTAL